MKNIHILPTDKPSRLGQSVFNESLHFNSIFNYELEKERVIPQHIYITSDDEIKDCDYAYFPISNEVLRIGNGPFESSLEIVKDNKDSKKIILTTDQELIKDGIQAIDDEFLEWFVKNPSCEKVDLDTFSLGNKILYNVVFPKEEPKQETLEEAAERLIFKTIGGNYGIMSSDENDQVDGYYNTYEEAYLTFKLKWQQERMYSEEEVTQLLIKFNQEIQEVEDVRGWFEQFKKK